MSKVLEKVVYLQVMEYLEKNNILPDKQSGFRKGRGTATALSDVVGNILETRDQGEGTALVLLDYSRAFDALDTSLLLSKLAYYGFSSDAIKWFHSYLSNRSQYVEVRREDGTVMSSTPLNVTRGVPQGSILGPLLFILYTADITTSFQHCKFHMYADDTQMYLSFKPRDTLTAMAKITDDLERVAKWSREHSLILNPLKSKLMILGSKRQLQLILEYAPTITLNGQIIERVEEVTNLGLVMDPRLQFEGHINKIVRNCFYRLKVLYNIRDYLSINMRKQLVDSLILSRFNYCDIVYGPCLLARTRNLIQRMQNACARYCFKIPKRDHVTPYINENNILKMEARRKLHLASLLFGLMKSQKPTYLYEKMDWRQDHCSYSIRTTNSALSIPKHRTTAFRGSFRYSATKCWNDLPPPIRDLKTKYSFKSKYKTFLILMQKQQTLASVP